MRKIINNTLQIFSIAILTLIAANSMAQSQARVENVEYYPEGEKMIITYNINNSNTEETFTVNVNVFNPNGKNLIASNFTGDVGSGIYGGPGKRVVWNAKKDKVTINDQISVDVSIRPEVTTTYAQPAYASPESGSHEMVSIGNALLQSLIFPGWGNRSVKGNGPYWVMGIVGYGAIGGAIYFNNKADKTYQDYRYATTVSERDQLFDDAEKYKKNQNALMYSAVGIWVIDLIWTGIQANNARNRGIQSKVDVGYYYNPEAKKPMVMFTYKF